MAGFDTARGVRGRDLGWQAVHAGRRAAGALGLAPPLATAVRRLGRPGSGTIVIGNRESTSRTRHVPVDGIGDFKGIPQIRRVGGPGIRPSIKKEIRNRTRPE